MGRKENRQNFRKFKVALVIILLIPIVIFAFNSFMTIDIKELNMRIKVEDVIGINVENSSLNFGKSYPGSLVYRKVNLTNNHDFKVKIKILNTGDISDFVYVSENNFILNPDEIKQVIYYVDLPKNIEYRNYTGTTKVIFKRKL